MTARDGAARNDEGIYRSSLYLIGFLSFALSERKSHKMLDYVDCLIRFSLEFSLAKMKKYTVSKDTRVDDGYRAGNNVAYIVMGLQ